MKVKYTAEIPIRGRIKVFTGIIEFPNNISLSEAKDIIAMQIYLKWNIPSYLININYEVE